MRLSDSASLCPTGGEEKSFNNIDQEDKRMRRNFGVKPMVYPMPVFIIGTYDEYGTPNAMNAAWGRYK